MPIPEQFVPERTPAPFDPRMMARSVIALPLLAQIRAELKTRREFEEHHPEVLERYNAAVFLHPRFPGSSEKAREKVLTLLESAIKRVPEAKGSFIDPPRETSEGFVCLARFSGKVTRLLLAMDEENPPMAIERIWPTLHDVIIEVNLAFKAREEIVTSRLPKEDRDRGMLDARLMAKQLIVRAVEEAISRVHEMTEEKEADEEGQSVDHLKTELSHQYVFARLKGEAVQELVRIDEERALAMAQDEVKFRAKEERKGERGESKAAGKKPGKKKDLVSKRNTETAEGLIGCFRTIHHVWPDFEIRGCITRSIATVKADAAHRSFTALGEDICWAIMDSGIAHEHPHFALHQNIDPHSTYHADFSAPNAASPLTDEFGHGTHVAGIIAGEQHGTPGSANENLKAAFRELNAQGTKAVAKVTDLQSVSGMAPKCKLVSLKVLDEFGKGNVSNLMAAIAHIQTINGHGREFHIHGVNISLGYPFDPKWFACGRSPLCVEVNRLVKSGVVVVVAAGNTGYGTLQTAEGKSDACLDLTINDPGNAEEAITVGSTHRDMPHVYGVSFFSSKGPTGDGRFKPDLLAPGEKIISCATGKLRDAESDGLDCAYVETSGTSMAAPHVSGAIAAFLSIRQEFIGETAQIKSIFTGAATDLRRDRYFQGAGLVDLMRAIQSV